MRTIGTEEHFVADDVLMAWGRLDAGLDRADQERIAAGNWDALVVGIRR